MNYNHRDKNSSTITIHVMCAIVFSLFSFCWLYFFQADVLMMAQHVLSKGVTHYNPLIGACVITLLLYLLQKVLYRFLKLKKRSHALTYLPSMLILGSICIAAVLLIPAIPVKLVIMLLAGILLGPVYSLTTYLGGHSAPENTGMAYAAMAFGASIGGVAFQPLAALAIGPFPVTAAYVLVIALCILDSFLIRVIEKREKDI